MSKALISRAGEFDIPSLYLSTYGSKLVQFARDNGYIVTELYNDDSTLPARLTTFEAEMEKRPNVLLGLGHGNATVFTGMDLEVLLKTGVNDDLCSGIKTYLWACHTATTLGPSIVEKTCPEFYGYQADWTFIYHPDYESKPLEDPWARAFFDCGLATGYAVLLGKTPQEIYDETLKRYDYWWDYWTKQEDPMADEILTWLNWDKENFMAITPNGLYKGAPAPLQAGIPPIVVPLGLAGALLFLLSRQSEK